VSRWKGKGGEGKRGRKGEGGTKIKRGKGRVPPLLILQFNP